MTAPVCVRCGKGFPKGVPEGFTGELIHKGCKRARKLEDARHLAQLEYDYSEDSAFTDRGDY